MVRGHKEDASFKKCRITLLQLISRSGQGQSPRLGESTSPATAEHPALFIRTEGRRLGAEGEEDGREGDTGRKTEHTFLQVKVLMPIILLLTSIFELLEMEVFSSILICNHK